MKLGPALTWRLETHGLMVLGLKADSGTNLPGGEQQARAHTNAINEAVDVDNARATGIIQQVKLSRLSFKSFDL